MSLMHFRGDYTAEQAEWIMEAVLWPEMPRINHDMTVQFVDAPGAASANAHNIYIDPRTWTKHYLQCVFVHEWAHAFDKAEMDGWARQFIMDESDAEYAWVNRTSIPYFHRIPERFAGTVTQLICLPRIGTAGTSRTFKPLNLEAVRRVIMPFLDMEGRTDEEIEAVFWLLQNDITTGYPDGSFRPDEPVSRVQMALFLQRALSDT